MRGCKLLGLATTNGHCLGGPASFVVITSGRFGSSCMRGTRRNDGGMRMLSPALFTVLGSLHGDMTGGRGLPPCIVFRSMSLRRVTAVCPRSLRRLRGVRNIKTNGTGHCNGRFYGLVRGCYMRGRVRQPRRLHIGAITGGSLLGIGVVRDVSQRVSLRSLTDTGNLRFTSLLSRVRTVICDKAGLGVSCFVRSEVSSSGVSSVCSCFVRDRASSLSTTLSRLSRSCARRSVQLVEVGFLSRRTGWSHWVTLVEWSFHGGQALSRGLLLGLRTVGFWELRCIVVYYEWGYGKQSCLQQHPSSPYLFENAAGANEIRGRILSWRQIRHSVHCDDSKRHCQNFGNSYCHPQE